MPQTSTEDLPQLRQRGRHAWTTPAEDAGGLAWCSARFEHWANGNCWALLPDDMLPRGLLPLAQRARVHPLPGLPQVWPTSPHGACLLCSMGEVGAEHLLCWCPAVAEAWRRFSGADTCLLAAALHGPAADSSIAEFPHQVAYLDGAIINRATFTCDQARSRLLSVVRSRRGHEAVDEFVDYNGKWCMESSQII